MMTYDSYKDSEIDWLGDVPSHWGNTRIDWIGSLIRGNSAFKKDELLDDGEYVALQYGKTYQVDEVNNEFQYYVNGEFFKKNQVVNHGDTILISTSETIQDLGHSCLYNREDLGLIGGEQILFKPNRNLVYGKYLYYYSKKFSRELQKYATGLKVFRFNIDDLKQIFITIPSIEEQTTIASYLDTKTQAIDKKVSLLQKKISYYQELRKSLINDTVTKGLDKNVKLKDSQIEWIGQIPVHWQVKRLKDCFSLFTGNSISDKSGFENPNDSIPYVATKDIDFYTGKITYNNGIYIPIADNSFKRAKPNSTLICIEGANAGKKIGFTEKRIAFVNKLCAIKSNNLNNYDKYLYYFTQTNLFNSQFFSLLNGLIGGVSVSLIKHLNILIPTKDEQLEIVEYLDLRLFQIDKIITSLQTQISTLKELRKTLINDVVTGKIKVIHE